MDDRPEAVSARVRGGGDVRHAVVGGGRRNERNEGEMIGAALADELVRFVGEEIDHSEAIGALSFDVI